MEDFRYFDRAQCYVGSPYSPGQYDCADLAVQVQREVFGRAVALPAHGARPASVQRVTSTHVQRLRDALADRIDAPVTGCAVLLYTDEGTPERPVRRWHVGTAFVRQTRCGQAETWLLHNSRATMGAALQRLDDVLRTGLRLDGYYVWRAA